MCFFLGCGLEVFFIFWVPKFLADFNQKFSKIYSNLHLEKKRKKKVPISGSIYGKILPLKKKKTICVDPKNYICQASNIKL
jgi:hypothetical protein